MTNQTDEQPKKPVSGAPKWVWPLAAVVLLVIVGVVVAVTQKSSSPSSPEKTTASTATTPPTTAEKPPAIKANFTGSGFPNGDARSWRRTGGPIDSKSVSKLEVAWTRPIDGSGTYGSYAGSPIVARGVVYSQDLGSNVEAIDQKTGKLLWRKAYDAPSAGPNGVNVADGRVYGATSKAAFALDQKTGKELWSVDLAKGAAEGIDMAPGYRKGLVYVSTVPVSPDSSAYSDTDVGTLWALDAKTGKKRWHFATIADKPGTNEPNSAGGGLWYAPSFDESGGMYFGVGNPSPYPGTQDDPWGTSRPGRNLYSNSLVKLDAKTGKLKWFYQQTPHDLYDWDLQGPPVLINSGGRNLAVIGGKSGFVIAVDRATGKLAWERSVGKHNGHDDDGLLAMKGKTKKLEKQTPMTIYPGVLGGVISPISTNGKEVFVPVIDNPASVTDGATIGNGGDQAGLLMALSVGTGKVKWKTKLPTVSFGQTSVANDLVFVTTIDGKVLAYKTKNGKLAWSDALPVGTNTGVTLAGDTLIAPAGLPAQDGGGTPQIVAYRLGKK